MDDYYYKKYKKYKNLYKNLKGGSGFGIPSYVSNIFNKKKNKENQNKKKNKENQNKKKNKENQNDAELRELLHRLNNVEYYTKDDYYDKNAKRQVWSPINSDVDMVLRLGIKYKKLEYYDYEHRRWMSPEQAAIDESLITLRQYIRHNVKPIGGIGLTSQVRIKLGDSTYNIKFYKEDITNADLVSGRLPMEIKINISHLSDNKRR